MSQPGITLDIWPLIEEGLGVEVRTTNGKIEVEILDWNTTPPERGAAEGAQPEEMAPKAIYLVITDGLDNLARSHHQKTAERSERARRRLEGRAERDR